MRAVLPPLHRWLGRHGRTAGAWRDVLELLSATALCALLEGWWRLRYSDAMTPAAARLTLALLPIAPLALAAAAGGYMQAQRARMRGRRADIALYRVLGGDMRRAAGRQALAALCLMPPPPASHALLPLPLTALGALAAGLTLAAHAAWQTWSVPASYDLTAGVPADDAAGEPGDNPEGDNAGSAIEQHLRLPYAASPLMARRKRPLTSRYSYALNPLLLLIYALLIDKHHQLPSHEDDDLARTDEHNNTGAGHHAAGWQDTAANGAIAWHEHHGRDAATSAPPLDADTGHFQAGRAFPAIETDTAPPLSADRAMASLMAGAASSPLTLSIHADQPHAVVTGMPASAGTGINLYEAGMEATPHKLPSIGAPLGLPTLAWSALNAITIAPYSNLQQGSVNQIGGSDQLVLGVVSGPLAILKSASISTLMINAISLTSEQPTATLSQSGIGSQTGQSEAALSAAPLIDAGTVHAGATSELLLSAGIVIVGQPLNGHEGSLHFG
ncbi:hypothetical protein [Rugamonas sp.]|uniref:hypothetical protein n=1 Tax=Rugamonas sp. TaxID=1926287 RepID=UPI0025E4D5DD|nr:hypothetical protein [Rugamonas sp.]